MKKEIIVPLIELNDDEELWCGKKLRKKNTGMNIELELDFYDYILAYADWNSSTMMMINITENCIKAGYVYGGTLGIDMNCGKAVVTKSALRHTLGDELTDWYLIKNQ